MKLPKPSIKLPKPGGNKAAESDASTSGKLPRFHLKNGFLKKNLVTLIAIAVLLVGTGTAYGTLATRDVDRGDDPVSGVNEDRYQVLVSGEGYTLTKQQERNYKLQKKQNEVNAARAAQNAQDPTTIRTSNGMRTYRTSNYRYRYNRSSSYTSTGTIYLSSNLYSQLKTRTNWKAGDEVKFYVTAYTYLHNALYTVDPEGVSEIYSSLAPGVHADLAANRAYWRQFEGKVSEASDKAYDSFLKNYDQELGRKSYGAVVDLLMAYYG